MGTAYTDSTGTVAGGVGLTGRAGGSVRERRAQTKSGGFAESGACLRRKEAGVLALTSLVDHARFSIVGCLFWP